MNTRTLTDFDKLVNQHRREILAYLWRMMRDYQDAEDALQETFLRAFRGFPQLKDHANLRAWLYKIATNSANTHLKRRTRLQSRVTDLTEFNTNAQTIDSDKRDLLEDVLQAIESLPYKQRAALILHKYQGFKYAEIAVVLDCSSESARANVYQALKKLRQQFLEGIK